MKPVNLTIVILIVIFSTPGRTARELQSLEERIERTELVIVGELGATEKKFSIIFDDYMDGMGADQWNFKCGVIAIDQVIMGELRQVPSPDPVIWVALHAGLQRDGKHVTRFPNPPTAHEGDRGIWLLRRGQFIKYYGLATYDCFLPIDSLEAVKAAIERVQRNVR
jgi:hypothetical protein